MLNGRSHRFILKNLKNSLTLLNAWPKNLAIQPSYKYVHNRYIYTVINNVKDYKSIIETKNNGKNYMIQLSAAWCNPCKMIKSEIERLSTVYPSIDFYYVDIDTITDAGDDFDVKVLPTFVFLNHQGHISARSEGNNIDLIKSHLDELK